MQAEQQSERERFEAYIAKDCGDLSTFGVDPNRHYRNSGVNHAWVGWQARAALSHPSPQGWPCEVVEADFSVNTVTLQMKDADYLVSVGEYRLIPPQTPESQP